MGRKLGPRDLGRVRRVDASYIGCPGHPEARLLLRRANAVDVDDGISGYGAGVAEGRRSRNRRRLPPRVGERVVELHIRYVVAIVPAADQEDERIAPHPRNRVVGRHGDRSAGAPVLGLRIEDIDVRHRCLAPVRRHGIATEQVDPAAHALGRPGQARGAGAVDLPPPVRLHVVAEGASVNARIQARRVESQKAEELIAPAGGDRRNRVVARGSGERRDLRPAGLCPYVQGAGAAGRQSARPQESGRERRAGAGGARKACLHTENPHWRIAPRIERLRSQLKIERTPSPKESRPQPRIPSKRGVAYGRWRTTH